MEFSFFLFLVAKVDHATNGTSMLSNYAQVLAIVVGIGLL
jgi:hypothetical protein